MTSRYYLLFALALSMLISTLSVQAVPSLYGDNGLVLTPNADVMTFTHFDLAMDYMRLTGGGGETATALPIRLDYGIADGVELFANYASASANGFDAYDAGVKVQLTTENVQKHYPKVAVGARITRIEDVDNQDQVSAYLVSSARLFQNGDSDLGGYLIRGHIGVEYLRVNAADEASFVSAFGGVTYEAVNGLSIALDYIPQLKDSGVVYRKSAFSGILRFPLSSSFIMEVGGTRPFAQGDSSLIFGVVYHYGDKTETPDREPTIMY